MFRFNIYLTTRILFGIRPQLLVLVVTLFQLTAVFVSNFAAISLNRRLHAAGRLLASIQFHLFSGSCGNSLRTVSVGIVEKMRILVYYEQLHTSSSSLGYTAGPIGIITAYSSFKVIFGDFFVRNFYNISSFLVCYFLRCLCSFFLFNYT